MRHLTSRNMSVPLEFVVCLVFVTSQSHAIDVSLCNNTTSTLPIGRTKNVLRTARGHW